MKLEELKAKIANVEAQLKEHNQKAIELDQGRATTGAVIHTLNGALQAYQDMKNAFESESAGDLVNDAATVIDSLAS